MQFVWRNILKITSVFFLAMIMAACGGGSSSESILPAGVPPTSGTATLTWIPPTTNEDSTTLDDLAGYKLYYGTSSNALTNVITIGNPGLSSYVIEGLTNNMTYYFAIKAVDNVGNESVFSTVVSKFIPG